MKMCSSLLEHKFLMIQKVPPPLRPIVKKSLSSPPPGSNITEMMTAVSLQIVGIIEPIIQHADWFFPGGEDASSRALEKYSKTS